MISWGLIGFCIQAKEQYDIPKVKRLLFFIMEALKFNVKDKSLHTFFGITKEEGMRREISPYHLLRNEIILPKKPELPEGTEILFELEDESKQSLTSLLNYYTYLVEKYDDVSVKLVLINFYVKQVGEFKTKQQLSDY